ncbi:MAG: phage terminase large subunit [Prevotellaceae bacterium]|jgi:predicted phage terminase large subunit-like protein|nr:phage terminase large subunit [Prevotellaceae bacterium]
MSSNIKIRDIDIIKTWCLLGLLNFTRYFFKKRFNRKFVVGEHHEAITALLDDVFVGKETRVCVNIAPRYSKTELAVKNFISMGFALNPKARFLHLSYSDDLVRDNSKDIQSIMNLPEYKQLFTATPTSTNSKKWYTKEGGGLYAVSSSGQVTGFGAGLVDEENEDEKDELTKELDELASCIEQSEDFGGAIIIDDPIKPDDARSELIREKVNQKFETTIRSRVNSRKTPIIIIMQRLDENDLCGYLQRLEPGDWTVLSLPCIYIDEQTSEERALWPFKHTLAELYKMRDKNSFVFNTQYMQNPKPLEGLMYEKPFKEYEVIPITQKKKRKNYTDTADTGEDYLCSIDYVETEIGNFVLDVLYTQKPMEYTETKLTEMLTKDQIEKAVIESNNGGRSFARAVEAQCRIIGNDKTRFKWFHQGENKHVRIFNNSAPVNNLTYFPKGWDRMWPEFYRHVTTYMKVGTNDYDDAEDTLTGTIEERKRDGVKDLSGYFD